MAAVATTPIEDNSQTLVTQVPEEAVTVFNGEDGANAYVYIASADDDSGTNFTYPQDASQAYIGVLNTNVENTDPQASDFSTVWRKINASDGADGTPNGLNFKFSSNTAASDPGSGKLKFNNANVSLLTALYISETDRDSTGVSAYLALLNQSTSTNKATVIVRKTTDSTKFVAFQVTAFTDSGSYDTVTCTYISASSSAPFTDLDNVQVEIYITGDKGTTGSTGSSGAAGADGDDAVITTTSTTSLSIGTGSKAFTTATALTLGVGSWVLAVDTSNPQTNYVIGQITSISGTACTINSTQYAGSGTVAAWTLTLTSQPQGVFSTTSTSTVSWATGSRTFTTAQVLNLGVGANVLAADTANPDTKYMYGKITSISGTSVTINITYTSYTVGNNNSWTLSGQGEPGKETNTGFQTISLTVPTASILTGNSIPVTFIPAQGTNAYVKIIEGVGFLDYNSAAYTSTHDIQFVGASSGRIYASITSNILTQTADKVYEMTLPQLATSTAAITPNEDIQMKILTGDPATGDSGITFSCTYKVYTF